MHDCSPYEQFVFMRTYVADPQMNQIAKRLGTLKWQEPLSADEQAQEHEPASTFRRVALLPDLKTWVVRIYLGGAQRTLGYTREASPLSAMRFADMAMMYLWIYRVRGAHEPSDHELNFSTDRAKSDLLGEPEALQIIKDIEHYLLGTGAIATGEDRQRHIQNQRDEKSRRRTVSGTILDMQAVWDHRLNEVRSEIDKLAGVLARIEASQSRVNDILEKVMHISLRGTTYPGTSDPLPPAPVTTC